MGYNKKNYVRIREEYESKYLVAREIAELHRAEIHLKIPEVADLDRALHQTGLSIMKAAMEGQDVESTVAEIRRENAVLQAKRAELLTAHGYPADYTDVKYECELCGDTGFVDFKMCRCMRKKIIEAGYESSGMGHLLSTQTFENFDLSYYNDSPAVLKRMTAVFKVVQQFAYEFQPGKSPNLAFFGGTGLGKTHLSSAVAKTVIDCGHDVFYINAVTLFSDFERNRFGSGVGEETGVDTSRYYDCDLLIIDDLGSEVINKFTTSVLYNIINSRLNRRQSTIISTNFSREDFRKQYWDRITSRVLGEYLCLPFEGRDIRAKKIDH